MNPEDEVSLVQVKEKITADPFARHLDMRFLEVRPGYAVVEMAVSDSLCNFLGGAHGAAIFAVADAAFGAASNGKKAS